MKQLDGGHFAASLRDLEAVAQEHGFAVDPEDSGQALKQDLDPTAAEGIGIDGAGMKEIEQAVIEALTESESTDDAGDAEKIGADGHAGESGGEPEKAACAGTGRA